MTNPLRAARPRPARAVLRLAGVFAVLVALAAAAGAQSRKPGPAVGSLVAIGGGALTFDLDGSNSRFTNDAEFSATRGDVAWTPFDSPAQIENGGSRAVLTGTIGGVAIDDYFAGGESLRILIRNGDGATTELDVVRTEVFLFVNHINRSPSEPIASTLSGASRTVDASADATVTLELKPVDDGEHGTDVVVAATFDTGAGINGRSPQLHARDTASSAEYFSPSFYAGYGDVGFYHFTLPDGTYRISAIDSVGIGSATASSRTSISVNLGDVGTIAVSSANRIFSIALPEPATPELADATLTIDGVAGLEPSLSRRIRLNVSVGGNSDSPYVGAYAQRDVGDPGPVRIPVRLVPGTYDVNVSVFRAIDDANGVGLSADFVVGPVDLAPEVSVSLPELAAVDGTIFDPSFTLATSTGGLNGGAYHVVSATGDGFDTTVVLGGFARSFTLYAPRNVALTVGASLTAALGKPRAHYSPSKNETASILLPSDAYSVTCGDGACPLDVTVPSLPKFVNVAGNVVDAAGRPVRGASVRATLAGVGGDPAITIDASVITKSDGTFVLRLPRGAGYRIAATHQ